MPTRPLAIRWRLRVRDDPALSPSTKLFAYTLSLHVDNRTGEAYPSLTTLAKECGYSVRTAYTAQKDLENPARPYITVRRRFGTSSVFTLTEPRQPTADYLNSTQDGGVPSGNAPPYPLDECTGCGQVLPLVQDALRCKECARA